MDLKTKYLGMNLSSPVVVSASPLSQDLENIKSMEAAGAGAVVLHSLFEEQLRVEAQELGESLEAGTESFAEALSYFPRQEEFELGPTEYIRHVQKAKEAVKIPIIASLNGSSPGGWTAYAKKLQDAGADALELNIYRIEADLDRRGSEVDDGYLKILEGVKEAVSLPVAVKLSPYFSNLANLTKRLVVGGADGLVLFNRFYQPDIDVEALEVRPKVDWSTSSSLRLPMRWIAILKGRLDVDFAATSGIYTAEDIVKMLMVGANVTMVCAVLYRQGIEVIKELNAGLERWLKEHDYASVAQLTGAMSQQSVGDPGAFERAQFVRALKSLRHG